MLLNASTDISISIYPFPALCMINILSPYFGKSLVELSKEKENINKARIKEWFS
jgi:hypothetical protein